MKSHLINQETALDFMFAGKAIFTLKSLKTGKHFTYKIMVPPDASKESSKLYWLMVLTGSDNNSDYTYAGTFKRINNAISHTIGKCKINPEAPSVQAINYVIQRLLNKLPMNQLEIWHEGRCCRCGRRLTTPESVENGIGPECASIKSSY